MNDNGQPTGVKACCFRKNCPAGPANCPLILKRVRQPRPDVPEPDFVREKRERAEARELFADEIATKMTEIKGKKICKRWLNGKCHLNTGGKKCVNTHGDETLIKDMNIRCHGNFIGWKCELGEKCPYLDHSDIAHAEGTPAPPPTE